MGNLAAIVLSRISRYLVWLVVIVVILVCGTVLREFWQAHKSEVGDLPTLIEIDSQLGLVAAAQIRELELRSATLRSLPGKSLDERRAFVKRRIVELQGEGPHQLTLKTALFSKESALDIGKRGIEVALLEQEVAYLAQLKGYALKFESGGVASKEAAFKERELLSRRASEQVTNHRDLQTWIDRLPDLQLPFSSSRRDYLRLLKAQQDNKKSNDQLLARVSNLDALIALSEPQFAVAGNQISSVWQPVRLQMGALEKSWLNKLVARAMAMLPAALWILAGVMFMSPAIKAIFYFVLAPAATRRGAICILPGVSGDLLAESQGAGQSAVGMSISAVSQPVSVDARHELLVHSGFLQSAAHAGRKDTKWLLDWAYPLTSLASGMVALARIRTESAETFVVSATKDPFSEIGVITVPAGSALILQPHSLVGLVQGRHAPARITSHWRLGSLTAWLTLQLRFLAFHGPLTLIVQGCRGVRMERADEARAISQAATIGFSANLKYSTTRCETFGAYLLGKQELLNDRFSGGHGHYVYEEMPHFDKRAGITGRGMEGLTDAFLKMFGI